MSLTLLLVCSTNKQTALITVIIIIIINKVLIKVTLNKVTAGALYIVICGWNAVKVQDWQLTVEWRLKQRCFQTPTETQQRWRVSDIVNWQLQTHMYMTLQQLSINCKYAILSSLLHNNWNDNNKRDRLSTEGRPPTNALTSLSSLASFTRQLKTELFTQSFPDSDSSAAVCIW